MSRELSAATFPAAPAAGATAAALAAFVLAPDARGTLATVVPVVAGAALWRESRGAQPRRAVELLAYSLGLFAAAVALALGAVPLSLAVAPAAAAFVLAATALLAAASPDLRTGIALALECGVVAVGVGLAWWVTVLLPRERHLDSGMTAATVALTFAVLAFAAAGGQLVAARARRPPVAAWLLLVAATAVAGLVVVLHAASASPGPTRIGLPAEAAAAFLPLLLAASVPRRGARAGTEAGFDRFELSRVRLGVLAASLLAMLAPLPTVDPDRTLLAVYGTGGALIAVFVFTRMALLFEHQRATALSLRASEELFRTAFEDAAVGIALVEVESSRIIRTNARFAGMLGYAPEDLVGVDIFAISPESDHDRHASIVSRVLSGELRQVTREKAYVHRDGHEVPVRIAWSVVTGADGGFRYTILEAQDISALRAAEEELRRSRELYRAVVESLGEVIAVLDRDATIEFISGAAAEVTGYEPGELTGSAFADLVADADVPAISAAIAQALAGGAAAPVRVGVERLDGGRRLLEATAAPILDGGAEPRALLTMRDVTEEHRLQEELLQAQKLEAVGRLAGGVAHDFNNLLTAIIGWAARGREAVAVDPESAAEALAEVQIAGERAADLTRQLLAFSRRQELRPEPLSLNEVVVETVGMLRSLIGEDVVVRTELAPELPVVRADRTQLAQVLLNLAINARDAMPGGGTLTIATEAAGRNGDRWASLRVADTGVGIDEETQANIFDPFFTTKEVGRGTGLGLSSVLGIVEQSGGSVAVESAPGRGSRFEVRLPAWADEAPAA